MSRGNIISIIPDPEGGIVVTFEASSGEISYRYTGFAAAAIMAGADPKDYPAERL